MTDKKITYATILLTAISCLPAIASDTTTEKLEAVHQEKSEGTALQIVFEGSGTPAVRHVSPVDLSAMQTAKAASADTVTNAPAPTSVKTNTPVKDVLGSKRVQWGAGIGGAVGLGLGILSAATGGAGVVLAILLIGSLTAAGAWMGGMTGAAIDTVAGPLPSGSKTASAKNKSSGSSNDDRNPNGRDEGCIPERTAPRPEPMDRRNPGGNF